MEQWIDIEDYEGKYQVSNEGRVKSLNYNRTGKECILKPAVNRDGYLFVVLCKDGKAKIYYLHRLVASAFIPNPDGLPQVNHKDEDKTNNSVLVNLDNSVDFEKSNLEWCTHEYNHNYGTINQRIAEAHRGKPCPWVAEAQRGVYNTKRSIPVDMLTKDGELIRTFPSSAEAMRWLRENGFPKAANQNINDCCRGKLNTAYGFKWRYANGN